jgi:hypothetical protein
MNAAVLSRDLYIGHAELWPESRWQSAVEVIVEHEVEQFINDDLINRLLLVCFLFAGDKEGTTSFSFFFSFTAAIFKMLTGEPITYRGMLGGWGL